MAVAIRTASTLTDSRRLSNAIDAGNVNELKNVLASEPLINHRDQHGVTALMRAACYNRAEIVRTLINSGADVNAARSDGFTPLLLAIFYGHGAIVRLLCESGADVNVTTRFGTSAHMWAVARGFHEIADYIQQQATANESARPVAPADVAYDEPLAPEPVEAFADGESGEEDEDSESGEELVVATPFVNETVRQSWYQERIQRDDERPVHFDNASQTTEADPDPQHPEPLVVRKVKDPLVVRTLKEPPEIWDLVHENKSSFNAGSAFFGRITSIKAITLLALGSIIVGALCAFVALNWRSLLDRVQPAAVTPSSSSQIASDSKPPVVNGATAGVGNAQTGTSQQVAPEAVSTSPPATASGVADGEAATVTNSSVPGPRPIGYRGARRTRPGLDGIEPALESAEKSQSKSPETSDTASGSNRTASSGPAVKPTTNAANSQLIERPAGSSTPKPKTIQWP